MAKRDLIISFLSAPPERILSAFKERPLLISCPADLCNQKVGRAGYRQWLASHASGDAVIPGLFRSAGGANYEIGRVAVMGFSNGCIGVDEILGFGDGLKVDCALGIDGVHGSYTNPATKELSLSTYKNWLQYGTHCALQDPESGKTPIALISHSSITPVNTVPPTSVSAKFIYDNVLVKVLERASRSQIMTEAWPNSVASERLGRLESIQYQSCTTAPRNGCCQTMGGSCRSSQGDGVITFSGLNDGWYRKYILNNFHVFGWLNKGKVGYADHLFQAQRVLPAMMGEFLVRRWGGACSTDAPIAGFGVFGGDEQGAHCNMPGGQDYNDGSEKIDYFPEVPNEPSHGGYIVSPHMPGLHPMNPALENPLLEENSINWLNVVVGLAGSAAGFFGVRYLYSMYRRSY